jgi:hypothetical protein
MSSFPSSMKDGLVLRKWPAEHGRESYPKPKILKVGFIEMVLMYLSFPQTEEPYYFEFEMLQRTQIMSNRSLRQL